MPDLHGFGPALLEGTWMTIRLSLAALALGLLFGLLGSLGHVEPGGVFVGVDALKETLELAYVKTQREALLEKVAARHAGRAW